MKKTKEGSVLAGQWLHFYLGRSGFSEFGQIVFS